MTDLSQHGDIPAAPAHGLGRGARFIKEATMITFDKPEQMGRSAFADAPEAEHPFWISRTSQPDDEFAECDSRDAGMRAMKFMLNNEEEDGPLYLFGPGLDVPMRAQVNSNGDIMFDYWR